MSTRERILDSAERLIAQRGYAATSLRHIIADAGVNLASVHYHFGSKEGLLDEVILRRATPVNEARIAMLERFETQSENGIASIEQILEAFMLPMVEVAAHHPDFVRLMGRMHSEGMMPVIIQRHFQPVVVRFMASMRRALPWLPDEEFAWRAHFMIGAMAHTVCATPSFIKPVPNDFRQRFTRLVAFLSAGFRAAVPALPKEVEVEK